MDDLLEDIAKMKENFGLMIPNRENVIIKEILEVTPVNRFEMPQFDVMDLFLINGFENRFVYDIVHVSQIDLQLESLLVSQVGVHIHDLIQEFLVIWLVLDEFTFNRFEFTVPCVRR